MATVRIVRGHVETPNDGKPESVDVPTGDGERIVSFGITGGYARSYDKPRLWNWWAYVTTEET